MLATLDEHALRQADIERVSAELANAERASERANRLSRTSATSAAKLDAAELGVRVARAELDAAKARLELTRIRAPISGQVLEILGPPDGAGRVSLPMHPEPRAVWNYVEQDASWDEISMYFLSLFFDDQVLSGYMWFTIEDLPIDNSAPEWIRQAFEK